MDSISELAVHGTRRVEKLLDKLMGEDAGPSPDNS